MVLQVKAIAIVKGMLEAAELAEQGWLRTDCSVDLAWAKVMVLDTVSCPRRLS